MNSPRPDQHHVASIRIAIIGLASILAVAACGSDDKKANDSSSSNSTPSSSQNDATSGSTTPSTGGDAGTGFPEDRGGIFTDFQGGFDRSSDPFLATDAFCTPATDEPAEQPTASDDGITATEISVAHIRVELEKLDAIGFNVPVGDPADMFETFTNIINDQCGGIHGRKLKLATIESDPLASDGVEDGTRACLEATEDNGAVMVMSSSGFGGAAVPCITEEHNAGFISTVGVSDEFAERAGNRLVQLQLGLDESLRNLATTVAPDLEGKKVAIIGSDQPGSEAAIENGLVSTLDDLGIDSKTFIVGCSGGNVCSGGVPDIAAEVAADGYDVVFNGVNVVSWAPVVGELVTQGVQPGDIQFYASNFQSQAADIVASKVKVFAGDEAAALYNGAIIVDAADTGAFRLDGAKTYPFDQMCNDEYAANGGVKYDGLARDGATPFGMTTTVCVEMRLLARALWTAGANPTREDIFDAMRNLGPVDVAAGIPASAKPDTPTLADASQTMKFVVPCPYEGTGQDGTCIVPDENYQLIEH